MAGFTMGEADTLRRAMGKKDRDLMAKQRDKFLAGCVDRGTSAAKAERVWELMEKFAGYGFNKCLAADAWIEMADGTRKPITAIRDGDVVVTKDGPHRALAVRPSGVRPVGRLTLSNGLALRCTPDHPIFTRRGWVNAEKLAHDDAVAVFDSVAAAFERVARRRQGADDVTLSETPMTWASPVSWLLEGIEPTYDFEVPGAASFIANGVAVHNSHAGAYALVAYQTAYFKGNYPVEFMAALLTSEMGDSDKIVKYIEECRAMGLTVSPPDVNVSAAQFSVADDVIRFGLAAIKNVGEAAMESILGTRAADGAFTTLDDFCARVDLRLVNRRVIESLVKAGAFDSLRLPRAHLLAQADAALEYGQRVQRDRQEGQASFFDALLPPAAPARREPTEVIAEWPDEQRLAYEKEVLGFYVSGHPLAQYASVIEGLGVTTSADLATRSHGARVTLLGHVAALKETATKSGNRMAFVTLEDMAGTVEVTVFPEPFKAAAPYLRAREPLVVRGRIDDGDKGRVILADDVRLLEQALGSAPRPRAAGSEAGACRIRVVANGEPEPKLAALRRICEAHPGGVPVFVHVVLAGQEVVVRSRGCSVDATSDLTREIEAFLGPGTLTIDYA
jgi:DNA polymerase III alpha subunit